MFVCFLSPCGCLFVFPPKIYLFILGCTGSLLLHTDSSCSEQGLLFIAGHKLLIPVASLAGEHGL